MLKVDVPIDASDETPWHLTRLSRQKYYVPVPPQRVSLEDPGHLDFKIEMDESKLEPDSDVYAISIDRVISVTPLSLDFTSRGNMKSLEATLRKQLKGN